MSRWFTSMAALTTLVCAGSPSLPIFQTALPIAPIATPYTSANVDGQQIDYYQLTIEPFQKQLFDGLAATDFVGYDGFAPGPTFYVQRGVQTVLRFNNNQYQDSVVHLHGSPTHSPWDGWTEDPIKPGQIKDYYYPNTESARSLWYHDHAEGLTSGNCFKGLTASYIIYDPAEDALGLPTSKYDVILHISDTMYDSNGQFVNVNDDQESLYGDVIAVNHQPWPYMLVEPRKYRLRLYNTAVSRPFDLHVEQDNGDWLNMQIIASDAGLFGAPVESPDVVIAMGERYEVVVDFSQFAGQNLTLKNTYSTAEMPSYANTNLVMEFVVGGDVADWSSNEVPSSLAPSIAWPQSSKTEPDRTFRFGYGGDNHWTINGISFTDANNRVIANPQQGTVELWELQHATGGRDFHPVHIHLVDFQIVSRTGGSRGVMPYESAGLKDIVLLEPGETVRILAYYGVWSGLYMFHCHNLIHEDHMMMAALNVTRLPELGYDNVQGLADPTDSRFIAQDWSADVYSDASIQSTLTYLGGLGAYNEGYEMSTALSAYYATNTAGAVVASATTQASEAMVTSESTNDAARSHVEWNNHAPAPSSGSAWGSGQNGGHNEQGNGKGRPWQT
ncbi:hypothetical protein AAFC00_000550 [Neodothiora populina]|uniref:Cupredoxin n=1 Tax=Neodothiora populina TaxID=2781224 RepID=A0ABR3PDA3_9PEZI